MFFLLTMLCQYYIIESILSILLIYLLGKWIDKVKEPYY